MTQPMVRGLLACLAAALLAACASPTAAPAGRPDTTRPTTTAAPATPYSPPTITPSPLAVAAVTATPAPFVHYLPLAGFHDPTPAPTPADVSVAEPAPTDPPTPVWPEPLDSLTASKLSLHAMGPGDPYIMEFVRRVKPRLVKSVGDFGWLAEVKQVSPQTITIGRIPEEQEEWILNVDPVVAGQAYVDINQETYQLNPYVDYWEGWNEFAGGTLERMQWFAQFEAARACAMQARGWRAAVGGFSTGVPEYNLMDDFLPALEAARRCGGIFHLHEYSSPTFDCGVAANIPGIIPNAPALAVPAGALSLRYRFWYEGVLKPRGLGDLPLVISELGIDGVIPSAACDDPGGFGWKPYSDWWTSRGLGRDGPHGYVNALRWYDGEMRGDSYVLGAAIFTAGALDAGNIWHAFDLHDVMIPLAEYAVSQR